MLFEILSRQTDHELKMLPANIEEFVFQRSANPENVLFTVLLYFYYSNPWAAKLARNEWVEEQGEAKLLGSKKAA